MVEGAKAVISSAVDEMASDMGATWDSALSWAAAAEALITVIAEIGGRIDDGQFAVLIGAAAMARRQSLHAPSAPETLS